jgi:hypothetical protein
MSEQHEGVVRMMAGMWSLVAKLEAAKARVAGMTAENEQRKIQGSAMAYSDYGFFEEAEKMEAVAIELRERI